MGVSSDEKRVLVTGGAGYLGSHLTRQLLAAGHKVRVYDSLLFGLDGLGEIQSHPQLEVVRADTRDATTLASAAEGCGLIVHLAALVGDAACRRDPTYTHAVNIKATHNLASAALRAGAAHLVFASTCSVYGASEAIVDEDTTPNPLSLYAESRLESERILFEALRGRVVYTSLRLGTLFGLSARMRFDLVVNIMTARAHAEGAITIFGGQQWRPLVHVRDAARGFVAVLSANPRVVDGQVFNLGDDRQNYQIRDVARAVLDEYPEATLSTVPASGDDLRDYRVSFRRIRERLGFRTLNDVPQGVREIRQHLSANPTTNYRSPAYRNA